MSGYYALLGQGPSLMDIANSALAARSRKEAREAQERAEKSDFERETYNRDQQRAAADLDLRKQQASEEKGRLDRAEALKTNEAKALAGKERYWSDMVSGAQSPEEKQRRIEYARAQGIEIPGTVVDQQTMGQAQATDVEIVDAVSPEQVAMDLQGRASALLGAPDPAKQPQPVVDEIAKAVRIGQGLSFDDPRFPEAYRAEQARQEALGVKRAAAGATTVRMGPDGPLVGLTTGQQGTQQGKVLDANLRVKQLEGIKQAIAGVGGYDAFASVFAEGKGAARRLGSKIGLDVDRGAIQRRARVVAAIGGFTNPIISELAGANVPEGEMLRMVQSLPTDDDDGPTLEAKIAAWEVNLQIIRERGLDALVNGIRTGAVKLPSSKRENPPDRTAQLDRLNALGREFKAQGMSDDQAKQAAVQAFRGEQGVQ